MQTLFSEGIERLAAEQLGENVPALTPEKRKSYAVFKEIVKMRPTIFDKLSNEDSTLSDLSIVAQYVESKIQDGVNGARSDDIKGLKAAVVDWLTPPGHYLNPMIARNDKNGRGFNHEATGRLLCPVDLNWDDSSVKEQLRSGVIVPGADQWPIFLYKDYSYDPEHPWTGLFRSEILIKAFKYVFTSPSSVEKQSRATRMGNARLHGMDKVTPASIAYIATLLRFSLCSASVFNRADTVVDSENFYCLIMDLLEDPDEADEVKDLMEFWTHSIFRHINSKKRTISDKSALATIRKKRAVLKDVNTNATQAAASGGNSNSQTVCAAGITTSQSQSS